MSNSEFWTIISTWYAIANIFILAVAALYYIKQLKVRVAALEVPAISVPEKPRNICTKCGHPISPDVEVRLHLPSFTASYHSGCWDPSMIVQVL